MDNLHRWQIVVCNGCSLCLAAEEIVDHLMLNCTIVQEI